MKNELIAIGPNFLAQLRAMVSWFSTSRVHAGGADETRDHHQATANYIARRPFGRGVPPRAGKRMGKARCEIWKSVPLAHGSTIRDLFPNVLSNGETQIEWVYNLSPEWIEAEFFRVNQDLFDGAWLVDCPCGVGSSSSSDPSSSSSSDSSSSSNPSSSSSSDPSSSSSSDPSSSSSYSDPSSSSSHSDPSSSSSSSDSESYDDPPDGPCLCYWEVCCLEPNEFNGFTFEPPCRYGQTPVGSWRCYLGGGGPACDIYGECNYNLSPGGFDGETRGTPFPCCH